MFKKETFKNLSIVGYGKIISIFLGLITISVSARSLGVEQYGKIALFIAYSETLNLFTLTGYNVILQKAIVSKKLSFLRMATIKTFISSVLALLGFAFFIKLEIVAIQNFDIIIYSLIYNVFRSLDKNEVLFSSGQYYKSLAWYTGISSLVRFVAFGVVSYYFKSYEKTIIALIVLQGLLSFAYLLKNKELFKNKLFDKELDRQAKIYSISNAFSLVISQIDKFVFMSISPTQLSMYYAGTSYPDKLREVSKTFTTSLANTWLGFGKEEFDVRLKKNIKFLLLSITIISVILYCSAYIYIPMLFGSDFSEAILYAQFSAIIISIKIVNHFLLNRDIVFTGFKRHQIKMYIYRIVYILSIFVGVKIFDIKGLLAGMLFTEVVWFLMLLKEIYNEK